MAAPCCVNSSQRKNHLSLKDSKSVLSPPGNNISYLSEQQHYISMAKPDYLNQNGNTISPSKTANCFFSEAAFFLKQNFLHLLMSSGVPFITMVFILIQYISFLRHLFVHFKYSYHYCLPHLSFSS